ncbi:hypothetical protein BASA81_007317 [Batrachochytrium salamandrivorans]|nr:hypothetical protein BASA81_007317 [Batrachochytrium salamandrivorans]
MSGKPSLWDKAKLKRDIRASKADFGVLAYDAAVNSDFETVLNLANEKKIKIDNWTQTVQAKQSEIQRLNEEAAAQGEKVPAKSEFEDDFGDYDQQHQTAPPPPPPPPPPFRQQ